MIRSLPLRVRLTVWYTLALSVVLCLSGLVVVWQQGRIGLRRVDRQLDDAAATFGQVLRDELGEIPDADAAAAEVQRTMARPDRAMAIFDDEGRALAAHGPTLTNAPPRADQGPQAWTVGTGAQAWRVHALPQTFDSGTFVLLIAAPLADVARERREAVEATLVAIPLVLLLSSAGGLWLASVGLRPITDMARRAAELPVTGAGDLGQSDRADEIGQLARAFNGLLARLRQALVTQRQFMADASHELRTPVSVIQSGVDVTLAREHREEAEYRDTLTIVGAQTRRLGRLVEDMLVLARADAGGFTLRRVSLYLNELVAECRQTVEVLAREHGVRVCAAASADVSFRGDEDLLRRMVLNLLQNAVQHTREGGAVRVEVSPGATEVAIRVRDEGDGIPEGDRTRIFDRFVQLDVARRSSGAGLGLPIARWIAEVHGGTLELEASGLRGSVFRVVLPLNDG